MKIGTPTGIFRLATILKDNQDGTITVGLDEGGGNQLTNQFNIPYPAAYFGPNGEVLAGGVKRGTAIYVTQAQSGSWVFAGWVPISGTFANTNSLSLSSNQNNQMGLLKPGRIVAQVQNANLYLDPKQGLRTGDDANYLQANPINNIISHNFETELSFTEAYRRINGVIKRDLGENSLRNTLGSTLDSQIYDDSLTTIGMDPKLPITASTVGSEVRNLPLNEVRELIYEFGNSYNYTNDLDESNRYTDSKNAQVPPSLNRRNMRTDALSLNLSAPNQLIEKIEGTVVDVSGNIVDLNRNPLPLGSVTEISLQLNTNKTDAFNRIRQELRKSLAVHYEINTRKAPINENIGTVAVAFPGYDVDDETDFSKNESKFFINIDKEGQCKINVPASSETGNVALLTRYENYSNLLNKQDNTVDPNSFIRNSAGQDVFAKGFGVGSINLSGSGDPLDGYASILDYTSDTPLKLGMAYHDIAATCLEFTTSAQYLASGLSLVNFDKNNHLNKDFIPLPKIVNDTIIVSGANANAGGRSATVNLDGMLSLNIGASTLDRHSIWADYQGAIISNVGRDLQGNSIVTQTTGDILIQVGGVESGQPDSRFDGYSSSYRNGTVDIRVLCNGQLHILRLSPTGIDIVSAGTITMSAQQDINIRTNSRLNFEAEIITMYAETSKRLINRFPNTTI